MEIITSFSILFLSRLLSLSLCSSFVCSLTMPLISLSHCFIFWRTAFSSDRTSSRLFLTAATYTLEIWGRNSCFRERDKIKIVIWLTVDFCSSTSEVRLLICVLIDANWFSKEACSWITASISITSLSFSLSCP